MQNTKKILAIFIVIAMIMSNFLALFSNMVFADGERTIYFNTGDYDNNNKTVTFHIGHGEGAVEVPVLIEGTNANLVQHEGGCKLVYTETLGDVLRLKVLSGFNSESMIIHVAGENNYNQDLQLGQNSYVILSGDGINLPNDFYFEIMNVGQGGETPQGQGMAIHFDTNSYEDKKATFNVKGTNVVVTISGTTSTIHEDGDNCGIGFTEPLGDVVNLQVDGNYNSETMEIYALGNDGFYHGLPVDGNRFIIFSGTDVDGETGESHNWGVPMDFHFGIVERGVNPGPQPGNNRTVIQFDTETFTKNTATFNIDGTEVTVTITGTNASIEQDGKNGRLEFEETLGNPVRFQVDDDFDPDTMEIYAADGGASGTSVNLPISEDRYIIFPDEIINRGGFHFGIAPSGGSPMDPSVMKEVYLLTPNDNDEDDIYIYSNKVTKNQEGITFDNATNTLTIENLNAPDKELVLHCIGENFKINVVGNNRIGMIKAFTQFDHWAQDIYITGNGTLTLNENSEADNAIYMNTYFGGSTLRVGANVTLNLKAKEDVIKLEMVAEEDVSGDAIIFENRQNINVSKEQFYFHGTKRLNGQSYYKASDSSYPLGAQMLNTLDQGGIYIGGPSWNVDENFNPIPETEKYRVSKYIYNSTYNCYFIDPEFEPEHNHEIVMTPEQFKNSEYSIMKENGEDKWIYNPVSLNMTTYAEIYKDSNDKEYVVMTHYNGDPAEVYNFAPIDGTPYYWLSLNTEVDADTLEPIMVDELVDDVYNYVVHGTELEVVAGGHVHNMTFVPGVGETCTTPGNKPYYICSECNDWFIDSEGKNLISNHSEVVIPAKGHNPKAAVRENTVAATCSKEGSYDEVVYCSVCNAEISRTHKTVAKLAHTPKEVTSTSIKKATLTVNGQIDKLIQNKCTVCGEVVGGKKETTVIPYPKTISLSKTAFTYNGKKQKPTVTVKGSDGKIIAASNYTVTYSNKNSTKVGEYTVTIEFKGSYYKGKNIFTYTIKPRSTSIKKLTSAKKGFKAKWNKNTTETSGYQIEYATNSNFTKNEKKVTVSGNKNTSTSVSKLQKKKNYYVRIRTYKKVNGKKIYSSWSQASKVKTK